MHVMWWMPSKRIVSFQEILACSNTSTEGAGPAADAQPPLPAAVGLLRLRQRPRVVAEDAGLRLDRREQTSTEQFGGLRALLDGIFDDRALRGLRTRRSPR